jgi:virginiamycin B lyase
VQHTRIPAAPGEGAAVRDHLQAMFADPPRLDPGADTAPALPGGGVGGTPGTWVSEGAAADVRTAGATVYVHGGGFAFSNPTFELVMAHRIARAMGRPCFAPDYRLAPAHPFPAAVDDVVAVHRGLLAHGVPAERIVAVGESAGATLVLSALLVLAAAGDPLPGAAVAVSPPTDLADNGTETAPGRDSLAPAAMGAMAEQYLAGARPDRAPQSPMYGDLAGLCPLLLAVGGDEILFEQIRRFAAAAAAAGTPVDLDVYDDMPHAFHAAVLAPDTAMRPTGTVFLERLTRWTARTAAPTG